MKINTEKRDKNSKEILVAMYTFQGRRKGGRQEAEDLFRNVQTQTRTEIVKAYSMNMA